MNFFKQKLTIALLALGSIAAVMTGCNKKTGNQPDNSVRHSVTANARIFIPGGTQPGGLWYFGTPYPGGCTTPCGNFCHAEPWNRTFNMNEEMQEAGPAYYTLTDYGQLIVEIDMTNVNPQHINEIISTGQFHVVSTTELPYQSIVQAYNNAGITSNIPHYKIPQGTHDVALNNTGTSVKVLTVAFTSTNTIDVSLEY